MRHYRTPVTIARSRFLVGPPVAGALDEQFGFRGPFIFGVIITAVEFICRLLIIERPEAARWDGSLQALVENKRTSRGRAYGATTDVEKREQPPAEPPAQPTNQETAPTFDAPRTNEPVASAAPHLSILGLLLRLLKSPRAMAPVCLSLIYGYVVVSRSHCVVCVLTRK